MDRARNVAKNAFWGLTGRVIDTLSYILVIGIVTRYLGVSAFGLYSFMMSIVGVALPVLLMSGRIISRDIARDRGKAEELMGNTMALVVIGCCLLLAFLSCFSMAFPGRLNITLTVLLVASVLSMGVSRSVSVVFLALENLQYDAMLSVLEAVLLLVLTSIVAYLDLGFDCIFIAVIVAQTVRWAVMKLVLSSRFNIRLKIHFNVEIAGYLVREASPLIASIFLTQLYINMGALMLMMLSTPYDVGLYQAPFRIISRLQIVPLTISSALLPLFSQLAADREKWDKLRSNVCYILKCLLAVSIPVSFLGFILADDIVFVLFGRDFAASAVSLRIQIIGVACFFIVAFFDTLFVSINRQERLVFVGGTGVILGFFLNLMLIPKYGYVGSSLTIPVLNVACVCAGVYLIRDLISWKQVGKVFLKPLFAASLVMIMLCVPWAHRYVRVGMALVMYPALLFFFKAFSAEEIEKLRGLLRRGGAGPRPPIANRDGADLFSDQSRFGNGGMRSEQPLPGDGKEVDSPRGVRVGQLVKGCLPLIVWGVFCPILRKLPLRILYKLFVAAAVIAYRLGRGTRAAIRDELRMIFPGKRADELREIIKRSFTIYYKRQAENLVLDKFDAGTIDRCVGVDGIDNLHSALSGGKGAIIMVAHYGSHLLVPLTLGHRGYRVTQLTITPDRKNAPNIVYHIVATIRQRECANMPVTFLSGQESLHKTLGSLRNNELVVIAIDGREGKKWVPVKMFGRRGMLLPGIAKISEYSGAPIVPAFVVRQRDDTHRMYLGSPISAEAGKDGVAATLQKLAIVLEDFISRFPCHYAMNLLMMRRNYRNGVIDYPLIVNDDDRKTEINLGVGD